MEEDLHMALCVVKVLALVVIAASLWSLSGSMGGSGFGYATDGYSALVEPSGGLPDASYLGPWGPTEGSQVGRFSNYEAPVFWNIGNISDYEANAAKTIQNTDPNAYDVGGQNVIDAMVRARENAAPKKGYLLEPARKGYAYLQSPRGYASGKIPQPY